MTPFAAKADALAIAAMTERRVGIQINAVVLRDFEHTRAAANATDEALAKGEKKPFLGLPMTVKESYAVAGLSR
jgi:Asp-tRNA(Asn)/Glu-tRNA(Gln) amidotransferase A subunit family amidase